MQYILLAIYLCFLVTGLQTLRAEKSIGIFTFSQKPWDPGSIQSGITGSEEAVIYISQELAKLGYRVTVLGYPPAGSIHSLESANPRYVVGSHDTQYFDIAISWRTPTNALELKKRASKVYFWPHDSCFKTVSQELIDGYDDVLWLSQWQREQWSRTNPGFAKFTHIYGNGINPAQFQEVQQRTNPYACIYGSNYAWGLEHLLDIWPTVHEHYPKATLDIYYGWQHWGFLSKEQERKMRSQIAMYSVLGVTEHGLVGHEELNRAYAKASFWTYPCRVSETFCITALRAQTAGCIPVIVDGSALKETVKHGFRCDSQSTYLETLLHAMSMAEQISLEERKQLSARILNEYTWHDTARKWHEQFCAQSAHKKLLILIIASDNHPAFAKLQEIWRSYMHTDKEHIEAYFLKGDPMLTTDYAIIGDTIYTNVQDSYKPGIIEKTVRSLQCIKQEAKQYDYILRTNLSSFYVFDRLLEFANTLPKTHCYAARALFPYYADVPLEYLHIPFGSGTGFILSSDLVDMMLEHKEELLQRSAEIPDDVLVGAFLHKRGVPIIATQWYPFATRQEWENQKNALAKNAFHFRAKSHYAYRQLTDEYADELAILSELVEKFYNVTPTVRKITSSRPTIMPIFSSAKEIARNCAFLPVGICRHVLPPSSLGTMMPREPTAVTCVGEEKAPPNKCE